jgi:hypothetical protein
MKAPTMTQTLAELEAGELDELEHWAAASIKLIAMPGKTTANENDAERLQSVLRLISAARKEQDQGSAQSQPCGVGSSDLTGPHDRRSDGKEG